jgi:molecular chaperone GrpE
MEKYTNIQEETAGTASSECNCNKNCGCHRENECQNENCQCSTSETKTDATSTTAAEEKYAELQDKYLRLIAEFDNYRKRTMRERIEMINYAGEEIIIGLLPVMDDLERAIKSSEEQDVPQAVMEGIKIIYQKIKDYLKTKGLEEIPTTADFNTDIHDAVTKIPVALTEQKGKVVDTIQKGYKLGDKVIRYAKVVVGE